MIRTIRGLSLTQPWAQLVAIGAKRIETRSWPTSYRGPVAIHAAKGFPPEARMACDEEPFFGTLRPHYDFTQPGALPRGAIIAVAELVTCVRFTSETEEAVRRSRRWPAHEVDFGDFTAGRYGFVLAGVRRLPEPVPCKGMLGLWEVPVEIAERLA